MTITLRRTTTAVAAAALSLGLFAAPASAAVDRHRHHHATPRQWTCVVRHGWRTNVHPASLRDPATRARFVQTLRDCGLLPPATGTTTTTTGADPGDPIRDT